MKNKCEERSQSMPDRKRAWAERQFRAALLLILAAVIVPTVLLLSGCRKEEFDTDEYRQKIDLLRDEVLTDWNRVEFGVNPAGSAGYAVFISVCDTAQRASVYTGTGEDPDAAWKDADQKTEAALRQSGLQPVWVKADVVYLSEILTMQQLGQEIKASRSEFFRYGAAFDDEFHTALLEAELNGAKIYDYDNGGIDFNYLNTYLEKAGRTTLDTLPETCRIFRCFGWLCDEQNEIWFLKGSGLDYGRREIETIDDEFTEKLILNASRFLLDQVKEDGSFVYGIYPRFDQEIDNYNIVRHASTLWSLICRYRMTGEEETAEILNRTIDYMISQIRYSDENTAYLYEASDDEIKLGGNSVAVIALTEYMDAFQNDKYAEICRKLGNGILSMLDQETGCSYHVLNGDFSRKEEFRTVYYDGEATFALCRLYGMTGEEVWLNAAQAAVNHFIEADYTQYKDHWVAYSMNEITKYITDKAEYYAFALENAQANLQEIYERDTTYHTYLEMLMVTFELYDRMVQSGGEVYGFNLPMLLKTIYARADRMLNGYFFPEYAMYMQNPQRILDTFMVRHDGYRVRIDDVQHNIGGYYMYYKYYDKLVEYGMLNYKD